MLENNRSVKNFLISNFLTIFCATIFCLSVFLRSQIDIGADTGIYLNIAKKISKGGKYYYDFFESNFPLSFYFYYLQYELAQLLDLNQILLSEFVINLLALGSIFWSGKILQKTTIYQNKAHYNLIIIGYFLSFFLRPYALQIGEFGTKTSLLLILFYPYLSFSFERILAFSKSELLQRGILMGLIPCLKPHYLILILCLELRILFMRESRVYLDKITMGIVGLFYLILMIKFTPEFFEFIVPMWPKIYSSYNDGELFAQNIWKHLGARIAIFSLIFLAFSRRNLDKNDKVLCLAFVASSVLIILENIGTVDQIVVFFAVATICFLKFIYDFLRSGEVKIHENKFIILCLFLLPIFESDIFYPVIFGLSGVVNVWWMMAFGYSLFLFKKAKISDKIIFYPLLLTLFILTILALKFFGNFAFIAANLFSLLIILFFFEPKFFPRLSSLSIFVLSAATSFLFYSYVLAISESIKGGKYTSPNQLSDAMVYYSKIYAPEKTDETLVISNLNLHRFPLLNYLEKEDKQKYHVASLASDKGSSGNFKMFSSSNLDEILTTSYLLDDVKNQMSEVKIIFVNNAPQLLNKEKKCLIGTLEYYFLDPEFRKLFFKYFNFKNRVILLNKDKSMAEKVIYDFEIYTKK
jgi:hypothetical protein